MGCIGSLLVPLNTVSVICDKVYNTDAVIIGHHLFYVEQGGFFFVIIGDFHRPATPVTSVLINTYVAC